jgi:tRNA(adenine34) deaminase
MNGSEQKRWMQILLERAREVGQTGEIPVSAVILDAEGRCIGHGRNRR